MNKVHANGSDARGGVLFAVFQNGSRANGGVESITQVIEGLKETPRLVFTNAETPATNRWRASAAETVVWPLPYPAGRSWRDSVLAALARRAGSLFATNWWTWRTLRRRGMTTVHCNDPAPFWHVALGARLAGVPLVLNLRDTKAREEGLDIRKYWRRFHLCSRVLVLSREMKEFYEQVCRYRRGERRPPIDYIYSVVDFEQMRPLSPQERVKARRDLGIADDTFAIGFIAAFNDKKNQLGYLNQAAPLLRRICPTAQTYFVGDFNPQTDPYARSCAESARVSQLEPWLHFAGFCADVEKWYQACDVIVVPTRKEGLARCMIEALACGTPVVSFDISSAREILEEHQCGRVVEQGNYEQLCRAIAELAQSPETRRQYAVKGTAAARTLFSADACLEKYRRLLLDLEEQHSASPRCLTPATYP
jgi:glycosyltransferase involved in cell wall biosynthesis